VTNSDITGGTGAISITGHAGGVSTGGQLERGFRLDSGALITSAGNISLTGTVSGNQAITPDPYPLKSTGGELAHGATVSSSGGDLALSGTFNNTYQWDGTGLAVGGKLQSGADKKIVLTGNATVGVRPVGGGELRRFRHRLVHRVFVRNRRRDGRACHHRHGVVFKHFK
jgi:hypothetical protein